jgi:aminobenzoyl-glutamate transport protein
MSQTGPQHCFLPQLLNAIERASNEVPYSIINFLAVSAIVIVLLHLFHLLGASAIDPVPRQAMATTGINSLLGGDGIRFIVICAIRFQQPVRRSAPPRRSWAV